MKTLQLTNEEIIYLIKATNTRWSKVDKRLRILDSMTEQEIADHDAELEGLHFFEHGEEVSFYSKERRELEKLETYLEDKLSDDF
jgi:ABC-type uncharacterized transport system fused permease/ATPase subunit